MTESLLHQVYLFAEQEGIFRLRPINQLDKTCCHSEIIEIVDFDHVKDELTNRLGYKDKPKSCDGLAFFFDENRLVFIEMKGFRKMEDRFLPRRPREDHERLIEVQVAKYEVDIPGKFESSLTLWQELLQLGNLEGEHDVHIELVLLTDVELLNELNAEAYIDFQINYLANETVPIDVIAQAKMQGMLERGYGATIEDKPLLLSCNQITEYLTR